MLDAVNTIYILTILMIVYQYYRVKNLYIIILTLHLFSIFLFNGFLFDATYMPDQFRYLDVAQNTRSLNIGLQNIGTVGYVGTFFALFPIPFINSLYSIGMINFMLYLFIFIFMLEKKVFNNKLSIYFYLFFPSLLMYSSLSLRDMLIFSVMFIGLYFLLIKKKHLASFFILSLLVFIKFQNLLIIIVSIFIWLFFTKLIKTTQKIILLLMISIVFLSFYEYFSLEKINYYRLAFFAENYSLEEEVFVPLTSFIDLFYKAIPSVLYFLLRPLPWLEFGLFQIVQFFENIVVFGIVLHILLKEKRYNLYKKDEIIFLNLFLLIGLVIYGLVSFNSGTAARYKFPFVTIYIVYSAYFINLYRARVVKCVA